MPELPEVETIKLELLGLIKNKTIMAVDVRLEKQVKTAKDVFLNKVIGEKVTNIRRRAKMLIFDLANGYHLVFHLKMTGQLIYRGYKGRLAGGGHPIKQDLADLPNKFTHVIFEFRSGDLLFFNDLRQFGWVKLVSDAELQEMDAQYGPEPLAKDFTFVAFQKTVAGKPTAIKPLLMDQSVIAGVGNIYAQEACYCANISPTRPAKKLNITELKNLYGCLRQILKLAVEKQGTSADAYVDAFGHQGQMEPYLKIYGHEGEKCPRCGGTIKAIKQGARTTAYCPRCQK